MDGIHLVLLAAAVFGIAALYSCVGHAGASGYIAVMALSGMAPETMKPTVLVLNILVATVAAVQFYRAGHFSCSRLWPFAVTSVPMAFAGGAITLPVHFYRPLVGVVLLFAAVRLLVHRTREEGEIKSPPLPAALGWGAVMGLVSGLTGVGGGIFLSPLLLFAGWSAPRQASATAAVFILVNSVAGLLGHVASVRAVPGFAVWLAAAAVAGGGLGSHFGSTRLPSAAICRTLSVVLIIAGLKLVFV